MPAAKYESPDLLAPPSETAVPTASHETELEMQGGDGQLAAGGGERSAARGERSLRLHYIFWRELSTYNLTTYLIY